MKRILILLGILLIVLNSLFSSASIEYRAMYVERGDSVYFKYPETVYPDDSYINYKVCIGYSLSAEDADNIALGLLSQDSLVEFPYTNTGLSGVYLYPVMVDSSDIANIYTEGDYAELEGIALSDKFSLEGVRYLGLFKSLSEIGREALINQKIKAVAFEDGSMLTRLDEGAFSSLSSFEYIDLSNTQVERIGSYSFEKTSVESVVFPPSVKRIESSAFLDATNLKRVVFTSPSSLTLLDDSAFKNTSLSIITIPRSLESIGKSAFENVVTLKILSFEPMSELKEIGDSAFRNTSIEKIAFPNSLETIRSSAFRDSKNLESIIFNKNSNLKKVEEYAFYNSPNLIDPVFPTSANVSPDALGLDEES